MTARPWPRRQWGALAECRKHKIMYKDKKIVVFGVSQDPTKYGYKIFTDLARMGLEVYGINPKGGTVENRELFKEIASLPVKPDVAVLVIPPQVLVAAVEQCIQAGVKEIWFQPGARSEEAYHLAVCAGIKAVDGCFMADNGFW